MVIWLMLQRCACVVEVNLDNIARMKFVDAFLMG